MKLRLEENMLRLRLSSDEVKQFAQFKSLTYTLRFSAGEAAGQCLTYGLELLPDTIENSGSINQEPEKVSPEIQLVAEAGLILIKVPAQQARSWLNGEQIAITAQINVGQEIPLCIIIEQDIGYQH